MLIVCPSCATSYQVGTAALGPAGRPVRCAHCKNTWFAAPSEALASADAVAQAAAARPPVGPPAGDFAGPMRGETAGDFRIERIAPPDDGAWVGHDAATIAPAQAPPIAPDHLPAAARLPEIHVEPDAPEAIETVAARRARRLQAERKNRRGLLRRLVSAPMLIVTLLAVLIALVHWRDKVVRQVPQTASLFAAVGLPVNLRGFVFQNVTSSNELGDGMPVLVIEGTIVNVTPRRLEVPRLRFALRNSAGHEVYAWTAQPGKPVLGSGDGLAFRTRLASPPPDGRDVIVRFFNRRDVTAGLQ
jgi:predicted Zn finger-like uncharacterized protein